MRDYTTQEIIQIFQKNHNQIWQDMVKTEHGYLGIEPNPHHLEGSVWAHTMMVMKEAEQYSTIIKLAALCHDLGKCYVWEDLTEKKKRRFSQHEAVSTFFAREVLRSFELDYRHTQRILEIVSQHGSLYNFFDDGRIPQKHFHTIVDRFSWDTFADLVRFYKCDHEGRFYDKDLSKNDKAVYEDFNDILGLMEIQHNFELATRKTQVIKGTLTVLVGAPRSGKSTWVDENSEYSIVVSRDKLVEMYGKGANYSEKFKSLDTEQQKEIDKLLMNQFQAALKLEDNIIIDMTNMSKKSRKKWLSDSKVSGYFKIARVFIEPKSVLMSRMSEEKNIPEYVIDSMQKSFVWPNLEEFKRIDMHNED